jgi:hypothetical protein
LNVRSPHHCVVSASVTLTFLFFNDGDTILHRSDERLGAVEQKLDDVLTHFDAIYHRFDRLESEYQALAAAVGLVSMDHRATP